MNKKAQFDIFDEVNWTYILIGIVGAIVTLIVMSFVPNVNFIFKLIGAVISFIILYVYFSMTE